VRSGEWSLAAAYAEVQHRRHTVEEAEAAEIGASYRHVLNAALKIDDDVKWLAALLWEHGPEGSDVDGLLRAFAEDFDVLDLGVDRLRRLRVLRAVAAWVCGGEPTEAEDVPWRDEPFWAHERRWRKATGGASS
jgi:hypothetical protein